MLAQLKQIAVCKRNLAVSRVKLGTLKQDRGEPVRKFTGCVKSLASVSGYTIKCSKPDCNTDVSYQEAVVTDQNLAVPPTTFCLVEGVLQLSSPARGRPRVRASAAGVERGTTRARSTARPRVRPAPPAASPATSPRSAAAPTTKSSQPRPSPPPPPNLPVTILTIIVHFLSDSKIKFSCTHLHIHSCR